jgi:hypothetical protein
MDEERFVLLEKIRKLIEDSHKFNGGQVDDIMNKVGEALEEYD